MTGSTNASGAGYNFKVVGGTTQPTGRENLIWVDTDTAVSNWIFSATQPTGTEGLVWFKTSILSQAAFNAVKRNGLWVYPMGCKQYVSGAWVDKAAKTYQNGEWIDWGYYLYIAGNECSSITGGWEQKSNQFLGDRYNTGTVIKNANNIYIAGGVSGGVGTIGGVSTVNSLDLSAYTTLHAKIQASGHNSVLLVLSSNTGNLNNVTSASLAISDEYSDITEVTLSIANVDSGYIGFYANSGGRTSTLHSMWLE